MAKWRNEVSIKKYLSEDDSDKSVLMVVTKLIPQLKRIQMKEEKGIEKIQDEIVKENIDYVLFNLEEVIGEFEWIKESIESNESATGYSYSDWCEAFNNYFEQLYDLGDTVVKHSERSFENEKFLWVS